MDSNKWKVRFGFPHEWTCNKKDADAKSNLKCFPYNPSHVTRSRVLALWGAAAGRQAEMWDSCERTEARTNEWRRDGERRSEVAKGRATLNSQCLLVDFTSLFPSVASKRFSHPALISDQPLRNVLTVKGSSPFEDRLAKHSCESFSLALLF